MDFRPGTGIVDDEGVRNSLIKAPAEAFSAAAFLAAAE